MKFYSGLTYSPKDVTQFGTLVLRSSNVQKNEIVDADNVYVSDFVATSEKVKLLDIVVVVRNGSRNLIGKHGLVKKNLKAVIGAFMTGIRSDSPNFYNSLLDSDNFKMEIQKNLGATINQITTGNFKRMCFSIPENPAEKNQIGALFRSIDDTIAHHQRELFSRKITGIKIYLGISYRFPDKLIV